MSSRGSITVWRLTWKSFVSNIENTLQNFRSSTTPYWRQRRVFKRERGCTGLLGPSPKSAPASGYLLSQNFENRAGVFIIVEVETVCGDANLSPNLVKQDFQALTVATSPETCASGPVLGQAKCSKPESSRLLPDRVEALEVRVTDGKFPDVTHQQANGAHSSCFGSISWEPRNGMKRKYSRTGHCIYQSTCIESWNMEWI